MVTIIAPAWHRILKSSAPNRPSDEVSLFHYDMFTHKYHLHRAPATIRPQTIAAGRGHHTETALCERATVEGQEAQRLGEKLY